MFGDSTDTGLLIALLQRLLIIVRLILYLNVVTVIAAVDIVVFKNNLIWGSLGAHLGECIETWVRFQLGSFPSPLPTSCQSTV